MSRGIGEDTPAPHSVSGIEQGGAAARDDRLSLVQVPDPEIKVELLRADGVRPARRLMPCHLLEGKHHPVIEVKRRPVVIERPPRVRLVQHAAEKRVVEPGQLPGIRAVQHDALQPSDHEGSVDQQAVSAEPS